jgi:hypothetical protein
VGKIRVIGSPDPSEKTETASVKVRENRIEKKGAATFEQGGGIRARDYHHLGVVVGYVAVINELLGERHSDVSDDSVVLPK